MKPVLLLPLALLIGWAQLASAGPVVITVDFYENLPEVAQKAYVTGFVDAIRSAATLPDSEYPELEPPGVLGPRLDRCAVSISTLHSKSRDLVQGVERQRPSVRLRKELLPMGAVVWAAIQQTCPP